mmetsp:Transcript_34510/g.63155  ORF Transcript_34510/g.63155 Transcript_34510/m.63155 type:complete len:204 (+) Transcript_34510:296-907(+)
MAMLLKSSEKNPIDAWLCAWMSFPGMIGGATTSCWIPSKSTSLRNQGWFEISSAPAKPSRSVGFLANKALHTDTNSSPSSLPLLEVREGKRTSISITAWSAGCLRFIGTVGATASCAPLLPTLGLVAPPASPAPALLAAPPLSLPNEPPTPTGVLFDPVATDVPANAAAAITGGEGDPSVPAVAVLWLPVPSVFFVSLLPLVS